VLSLKEKIKQACALPVNKQKLSLPPPIGNIKDNLSLAYYNLHSGVMLMAKIKERGGKKK